MVPAIRLMRGQEQLEALWIMTGAITRERFNSTRGTASSKCARTSGSNSTPCAAPIKLSSTSTYAATAFSMPARSASVPTMQRRAGRARTACWMLAKNARPMRFSQQCKGAARMTACSPTTNLYAPCHRTSTACARKVFALKPTASHYWIQSLHALAMIGWALAITAKCQRSWILQRDLAMLGVYKTVASVQTIMAGSSAATIWGGFLKELPARMRTTIGPHATLLTAKWLAESKTNVGFGCLQGATSP